jgi:NAD(P)-dependent dehydrogenase (short-subunit alcohol dehydrogenase family)
MPDRLSGKTVYVTGAAQGIGFATAKACAEAGATVVLSDIQDIVGSVAAASLRSEGFRTHYLTADVASPGDVAEMFSRAAELAGPPDVLVNNAGIAVFRDPLKTSDEDWSRCFSVDLDGVWTCCRNALPSMLARGRGDIINIASVHSFSIIPGCFPYPVAKHGLLGLTRALAVEYAAHDIRVNAIAPGYIDTEIVRKIIDEADDPAAYLARIEAFQPAKRIGRPEEIAKAVVFLASDEARYLTGQCITIDGGRSIQFHD